MGNRSKKHKKQQKLQQQDIKIQSEKVSESSPNSNELVNSNITATQAAVRHKVIAFPKPQITTSQLPQAQNPKHSFSLLPWIIGAFGLFFCLASLATYAFLDFTLKNRLETTLSQVEMYEKEGLDSSKYTDQRSNLINKANALDIMKFGTFYEELGIFEDNVDSSYADQTKLTKDHLISITNPICKVSNEDSNVGREVSTSEVGNYCKDLSSKVAQTNSLGELNSFIYTFNNKLPGFQSIIDNAKKQEIVRSLSSNVSSIQEILNYFNGFDDYEKTKNDLKYYISEVEKFSNPTTTKDLDYKDFVAEQDYLLKLHVQAIEVKKAHEEEQAAIKKAREEELARLKELAEANARNSGWSIPPCPISTGKVIYVNIASQKMYAYEDCKILNYSYVTTGKDGRDTPRGRFQILNKDYDGEMTLAYPTPERTKLHYWYWLGFTNVGHGIHDADPWRTVFGGQDYHTNGSSGCINTPGKNGVGMIAWIYGWADIGTPLIID